MHRFLRTETEMLPRTGSWAPIIPPQRVFVIKDATFPPVGVSRRNHARRDMAPLIGEVTFLQRMPAQEAFSQESA